MTTNFVNTVSVYQNGNAVDKTLPAGSNGQVLICDSSQPSGFSFVSPNDAHNAAGNLITMPAVTLTGVTCQLFLPSINTFRVYYPDNVSGGTAFFNAIIIGGELSATAGTGTFGLTRPIVSQKYSYLSTYYIEGLLGNGTGVAAGTITNLTQEEYDDIRNPLAYPLNVGSQSIISSTGNVTINPNSNVVDMTSSKIINCLDPTSAQDAATKNYTDTQLTANANASTELTWSRTIFTDNLATSAPIVNGTTTPQSIVLSSPTVFQMNCGTDAASQSFYNSIVFGSRITATAGTGTVGNELFIVTSKFTTLIFPLTFYYISGTRAGGTGAVAGSVTNITQAPYVTIKSPLNSALNVGSQSIISSTGNVTINPSSDVIDVTSSKISNCLDPTAAQDVATKNYVDTKVATPGVNIDLANTYKVINLAAPTSANDAANKAYVDSELLALGNGIVTYRNSSARNAAVPSPTTNSWTYLRVPDVLQYYNGTAWSSYQQLDSLPAGASFSLTLYNCSFNTYYYTEQGATTASPALNGSTVVHIYATSGGAYYTLQSTIPCDSSFVTLPVEYLLIAGGGGGGGVAQAGVAGGAGGGAGGYVQGFSVLQVSTPTVSVTYPVQVGTGGAGGLNVFGSLARGGYGNSSSLTLGTNSVTGNGNIGLNAIGGGSGGSSTLFQGIGGSGGSGGGGAGGQAGGAGTATQGFDGAQYPSVTGLFSGGGGGGGSAGGYGTSLSNGGIGITNYIAAGNFQTGFCGGGGAQFGLGGGGSSFGGGNGGFNASFPAESGINGTGGGGGGAEWGGGGIGGAGGNGSIFLRFATNTISIVYAKTTGAVNYQNSIAAIPNDEWFFPTMMLSNLTNSLTAQQLKVCPDYNGRYGVAIRPRFGTIRIGLRGGDNTPGNITNPSASLYVDVASGNTSLAGVAVGDFLTGYYGSFNTFVGGNAGGNTSGKDSNSYFGYGAGSCFYPGVQGKNNVCLGFQSGTGGGFGDNNIYIGSDCGHDDLGATPAPAAGSRNIMIDTWANGQNSEFQYGVGFLPRLSQPNGQILNDSWFVRPVRASYTGLYLTYSTNSYEVGYTSSNRRLKTDIEDLVYNPANFYQLRPRTFKYKHKDYTSAQKNYNVGFIAEEIDDVFPEVLSDKLYDTVTKETSFNPDPIALIAVMVAEMKKLRKELDEVKARLAQLPA